MSRKTAEKLAIAEGLKKILHYNPETGVFTRLSTGLQAGGIRIGTRVKCRAIRVKSIGKYQTLEHRLAWLYMTGEWPKGEIDHINGDPLDNRWSNLRDVPHIVNMQNQRRGKGKTGVLGVSVAENGKLRARITINKKTVQIGAYTTVEQASEAYILAKRKFHAGGQL